MADKIVKNSDLEHVQEKLVNEIETMLLSDPLVHALTGKGIQRFVSGITMHLVRVCIREYPFILMIMEW